MTLQDKWFAVVNPNSANGKTQHKWPMFYQKMIQAGIDVDYFFSSSQGNGVELTRQAIRRGYRKIIAVGGDGTVNEVVNGLFHDDRIITEGIELAVFGQGTGSDFIRTCKSRKNIDSLIGSLKGYSLCKSDVGKVTFLTAGGKKESRYFLNAANLGIGAEVVNRVNNRTKALGSKLTYFTGTVATILNYHNIPVSFQLENNKTVEGRFCGLVICNGQYIGGGMHIAPQAEIDDGMFDLIAMKDISKLKLFSCFPLIYRGKHIALPEIDVYRCQTITLLTPDSAILETDGEIIGYAPSEFRILPQCLTLRI